MTGRDHLISPPRELSRRRARGIPLPLGPPAHLLSRVARIGLAFNVKPRSKAPEVDDLHAEWDDEATIAGVEAVLASVGEVLRVEADLDLPFRLRGARPDIVFNIAEGLGGPSREAQVPALCELWSIPYTGSDPLTLALCLVNGRPEQ